ncbi:hypothetical protein ATH33_0744 [Thermoactinomyces vulgaris]|jgi:hypothetical protein|nr:hypothetical protein ATH33_0744 [Thermoactinomyces vulgaris]
MIAKKISVILVFSLGFLLTFFLVFSLPVPIMNPPPAKTNATLDYIRLNPPRPESFRTGQPETAHKCPVRLSRLILCFLKKSPHP